VSGKSWKYELTGRVPVDLVAQAEQVGMELTQFLTAWLMSNISVTGILMPHVGTGNVSMVDTQLPTNPALDN